MPLDSIFLRFGFNTLTMAFQALHNLGATDVIQSGRNDLALNEKKISGAAMTL
jgi:lipoate-protein ligase A